MIGRNMYSVTQPYENTLFIRPPGYYDYYSFDPNIKITESFYYFEDPVDASFLLLQPGFYGPMVVALTEFDSILQTLDVSLDWFLRFQKYLTPQYSTPTLEASQISAISNDHS